jgi:hypothetical protein
MIKEIKQVIGTNFTVVVQELQALVREGFSVVMDGEARPYHMVLGNFIITLERMVDKPAEEAKEVEQEAVVSGEIDGETGVKEVVDAEVAPEAKPVVFEPIPARKGKK